MDTIFDFTFSMFFFYFLFLLFFFNFIILNAKNKKWNAQILRSKRNVRDLLETKYSV